MHYELSPADKERIARIAERNALPLPVALEALLLLADVGEWKLEDGLSQPDGPVEPEPPLMLISTTLSTRTQNALASADHLSEAGSKQGIHATIDDLAKIPLHELMRTRGFGRKSLKEWSDYLVRKGYPPLLSR